MSASLLALAPAPVHASEPVVVAPARATGDLDRALGDQLAIRLREVVEKSDLAIVEVSVALEQRITACDDDPCRAAAIAEAGARFLLVPEFALDDRDYQLRLTLYAASGAELARVEETCGLCGLTEAADLLADLGARIGRKVEVSTRLSSVEVRSQPAGAKVFVAGELVGTTPLELPLAAGVHSLRIELEGHIALAREVEVVAGESATLELGLQPLPGEPEPELAPKPARRRPLAGLGWGALVLGAGTLAGGAVSIAIDERPITSDCSGANVDALGHCRWRYATLEGGVGLAVGGVVLIAGAIALLVVDRAKQRRTTRSARVQPRWGGFGLQF
ncbi:PEGA domain-containing protein [Nannocystaceae bacterium ST9]